MASCGGLQQIFENRPALPEKLTLIESLSWNQIKSINDPSPSSSSSSTYTEIFGELHFKEIQHHPPTKLSEKAAEKIGYQQNLQLCTEGLGFESFDDVEEINSRDDDEDRSSTSSTSSTSTSTVANCHNRSYKYKQFERTRSMSGGGGSSSVVKTFPPPISCIGRSGKPWICFKSYRQDGRFVLKEVRIPTHEFLHACREDGRLRLHLVQPDGEQQQQQQPPQDQQNDDDVDDQDQDDEGEGEEEDDDEKVDQSSIDEAIF
ncbi:hypothetical protein Sjap_001132 [Stephania japonica]|uniref:FAF domain-containing protein n=1 Tax=Stephania japonica TaxID=461633 RepID=A0AAP0PRE2_9MAGN